METAMSTLHSLMEKNGSCPIYEFVSQESFECRCSAFWITITATAPSVSSAQEEAAKIMLLRLAQAGYSVPPPYNKPMLAKQEAASSSQEHAKPREMRENEGLQHPDPNQEIATYHQGFLKYLDAETLRKRREMMAKYRQSRLAGKIAARRARDNETPYYRLRQKPVLDNLCDEFDKSLKLNLDTFEHGPDIHLVVDQCYQHMFQHILSTCRVDRILQEYISPGHGWIAVVLAYLNLDLMLQHQVDTQLLTNLQ